MRLIMLRGYFGRPFVAPPDVPAERAAVLRAAFAQTLSDPQLLRDAAQLRIEIGAVSGERLDELLVEAYGTEPELVERARELLN